MAVSGRHGLAIAFALAAGGCQFAHGVAPGDANDGTDADPLSCSAVPSSCADAVTLKTCSRAAAMPVLTTCNWGCVSSGTAHCGEVVPAADAVQAGDLDPSGLTDVTLGSGVHITTDNGAITGVTTGYDHVLRGSVQVFRFRSL